MFIMGHGVNTITRMPEAKRGIEKLELLVVCDPYPTAWSVLSDRKDGIYLLPACTSFEMDGSRPPPEFRLLGRARDPPRLVAGKTAFFWINLA
jgi:anaerobic selenocysteine-containing dehydrogenase